MEIKWECPADKIGYKLIDFIQTMGIFLGDSYKIHTHKQNKLLRIKKIGYSIEDRAIRLKDEWIEKNYGYQGGGGWTGDELEGVDDVHEYILNKISLINKNRKKYGK